MLCRNDFNKISNNVSCKKLFAISKHKTLYHMYSEVLGKTKEKPINIINQCLPVASISGATKAGQISYKNTRAF